MWEAVLWLFSGLLSPGLLKTGDLIKSYSNWNFYDHNWVLKYTPVSTTPIHNIFPLIPPVSISSTQLVRQNHPKLLTMACPCALCTTDSDLHREPLISLKQRRWSVNVNQGQHNLTSNPSPLLIGQHHDSTHFSLTAACTRHLKQLK